MNVAKLCILLSIILPTVSSTDYCSSTLCGNSKHIACNNNGSFSSNCVSNAKIVPMTNALRTLIVGRHNEYRNKIAKGFDKFSPAARMATMLWNSELSKLAELNVKQCEMQHDECRNTDKFKHSGQNLATSSWKGMKRSIPNIVNEHMIMWFDEYKDCSMSNIKNYTDPSNGEAIGHFTAMIQDKSTAVGCAILRQLKSDGFTQQLMACNYGYTNFINEPVYLTGAAASKCKRGVNKKYKFLCSTKEKY